jgi:predicted dehydrogenase
MIARVLLVGIGGYGENYLNEVLDHQAPTYSVVGICDPYIERSPRYDEIISKNITVFTNYDEALASDCNLVVISSPIHTHFSYMKKALQQGKNILCEKPPCGEVEELEELAQLEEKSGSFVAIGYQMCYRPDVLELKADILRGMYGTPILLKSIRLMRRGDTYYNRNGWAGKIEVKGTKVYDSPLSNACAHEMQNMLFLLGPDMLSTTTVQDVEGFTYRGNPHIENFDAAAICVTDTNATPLYFYTAHCIKTKKIGPYAEYRFTKAIIKNQGDSFTSYDYGGNLLKEYAGYGQGKPLQKFQDAIAMLGNRQRPTCGLATCKEHLRVVAAVQTLPREKNVGSKYETEGDVCYPIIGLETFFINCYAEAILPSSNQVREDNE